MSELREILSNPERLNTIVAEELETVRSAVASTDRRTLIDADAQTLNARVAAPVAALEDTFVLLTPDGMIARARKGRPDALIGRQIATNTHARVILFTDDGTSYGLDVVDLPALEAKDDPRPVPGLLGLTPSGNIITTLILTQEEMADPEAGGATLVFVSADGYIRRTNACEFARIPQPESWR